MQVFEQEGGEEKHLLSVGKYGAWNISKPEEVKGERWLVSYNRASSTDFASIVKSSACVKVLN